MSILIATLILVEGSASHCRGLGSPAWRPVLESAGALDREIVLAPDRLTKVDVSRLAWALHAKVMSAGKTWRLGRDGAIRAELREEDRKALLAHMKELVSRYDRSVGAFAQTRAAAPFKALEGAKEWAKTHPRNPVDESRVTANRVTPGARLLVEILKRLDAKSFDACESGKRVVFSTAPVGPERAFQVSPDLISTYGAEQAEFAKRSEQAYREGRLGEADKWVFPQDRFMPGARTLHLYVDRRSPQPSFALSVFAPNGMRESNPVLNERDLGYRHDHVSESRLGLADLSPQTLAAIKGPKTDDLGFDTSELDPYVHEPLDGYVREAVTQWGRAKGLKEVIGCIPDALLEGVKRCVVNSKLDLDALTQELERADCEYRAEDDVLILRPRLPLVEEALRVDRKPLSNLFRAASQGALRLEDIFAYHASIDENFDCVTARDGMERPIRDFFGLNRAGGWSTPHSILASAGKLTVDERRRLFSTGRMSLEGSRFQSNLMALAEYAGAFSQSSVVVANSGHVVGIAETVSAHGTDLDRTAGHVLAHSPRAWLETESGPVETRIQRVSKETGRFVDDGFIPARLILSSFDTDNIGALSGPFLFSWIEERPIRMKASLEVAEVGPFLLMERLRASIRPVPLEQVPGLALPRE